MGGIRLDHVVKVYPNDVTAIEDVDAGRRQRVRRSSRGVGCGKSTLLRMIVGGVGDRGSISSVRSTSPRCRRATGYRDGVQTTRSTRSVGRDSLAFGLNAADADPRSSTRVDHVASILGLRTCSTASRAALGRRQLLACADDGASPGVLMDEPLSNLDAAQVSMRLELAQPASRRDHGVRDPPSRR
jgi:ABC-type sugar transport system ATPase subunit